MSGVFPKTVMQLAPDLVYPDNLPLLAALEEEVLEGEVIDPSEYRRPRVILLVFRFDL